MMIDSNVSNLVVRSVLLLVSAVIILLLSLLVHDIFLRLRLPPGPTPIPFLGNKFDIPKSKPWIQFQEWSKQFGPIFTLWIGRKPTLIISDPHVASELMEKRSNKYSSRPRMVVMGEVYNGNASILMQPYNRAWSIRRKLLHQALNPRALKLYKPTQEAEASRLCYALLKDAEHYEKQIERFTSSVVFCVAYGHRINSLDAQVITDRFKLMHFQASLNVPGRYLAESFPILARLPSAIARWKKPVEKMGIQEAQANLALLDVVQQDVATAKAKGLPETVPDSLSKLLLEIDEQEPVPLSRKHLSYIPASLFGAGSDTTASTLCTAILALITHPDVLQIAQAELDSVVGRTRTPTFADERELPYLGALCKETLRWRPVAVLGGTPHASTEIDQYEGWTIPAGTTIIGNSWAINLNEDYYPHPHCFDPARFLSESERLRLVPKSQSYAGKKVHPAKSGHSSFGWGRRICPGADLAFNSLFIALAKILWGFDVLPIEGRNYDIFAYTEGFNIRPQKFDCIIRVRSEQHRKIFESEQVDAIGWLAKFTPFE